MKYRIVTEAGKEIMRSATEQEAEKYWDMVNGIYTDYDDNDKEYYIYIEEI